MGRDMIGSTEAIEHVLKFEGGYVNDPDDPGGETNFGISKRSYPDLDIAALTVADAVEILTMQPLFCAFIRGATFLMQ